MTTDIGWQRLVLEGGQLWIAQWPPAMYSALQQTAALGRPWFGTVAALAAAERERWFLWLPVLFGTGIAVYFALPAEPPLWAPLAMLGVALAGPALLRRSPLLVVALALAAPAIGFGMGALRSDAVRAPMLNAEIGPAEVQGRVVGLDILAGGAPRVLLEQVAIEGLEPAATPLRVRVRLNRGEPPAIGAVIGVRAILDGPAPPVAPGAFDFRRQAYFEQLGAVGFAVGPTSIVTPVVPGWGGAEMLRQRLAGRITAVLGNGDVAAITNALLTGERAAISTAALDAMRDSGLAHLLSISGLHFAMVAGLVYGLLRLLLALVEPVALRWPIKKWAAVAALIVAVLYTVLVGAAVPVQRAMLMMALVFIAILADRSAISMRTVAIAAVVVLAVAPESLLGPSFQMSFAAVIGLIAIYERMAPSFTQWRSGASLARRAIVYVALVALTSVIATAATAPFAAYHFQRLASYGVMANLLAVPLTTAWIMPWGLLVYLTAPFGLEAWPLAMMGEGVRLLLWIAETAAGWPGAALTVPAIPAAALAVVSLGGLWLCLWRGQRRHLGWAAIAVGMVAGFAWAPRPDVLVDGEGRLMAVRDGAGRLLLSSTGRATFERDIWLRRNGQEVVLAWPGDALQCDGGGCLYRRAGRLVALTDDRATAAEDCRLADIVVATVPVGFCPAPIVIDRFDLWREGGHTIELDGAEPLVESVADRAGARPWVLER